MSGSAPIIGAGIGAVGSIAGAAAGGGSKGGGSQVAIVDPADYYPQYLKDTVEKYFSQGYPMSASITYGGQAWNVPANSKVLDRALQASQMFRPIVTQTSQGASISPVSSGLATASQLFGNALGGSNTGWASPVNSYSNVTSNYSTPSYISSGMQNYASDLLMQNTGWK